MFPRLAICVVLALATLPSFASQDAKPDAALAGIPGEWRGSLTYRDYSEPDRLVTLPMRSFVAFSAPSELVMQSIFDDGPSKTVYSYERISFDFAAGQVSWTSGTKGTPPNLYSITERSQAGSETSIKFEKQTKGGNDRYSLFLSSRRLQLTKEEIKPSGEVIFRNRYDLRR
jgi:hypothetical protein